MSEEIIEETAEENAEKEGRDTVSVAEEADTEENQAEAETETDNQQTDDDAGERAEAEYTVTPRVAPRVCTKAHLRPGNGRAVCPGRVIPSEIRAQREALFPGKSEAEIFRLYQSVVGNDCDY